MEQQKLAVIDRLLTLNREYLRLTELRVQKGDAAPLKRQKLLRVEFNRDQAQRNLTQGRVYSTLLELKQLLDVPPTNILAVTDSLNPPVLPTDLAKLKALALQGRPDLMLLRLGSEEADRTDCAGQG